VEHVGHRYTRALAEPGPVLKCFQQLSACAFGSSGPHIPEQFRCTRRAIENVLVDDARYRALEVEVLTGTQHRAHPVLHEILHLRYEDVALEEHQVLTVRLREDLPHLPQLLQVPRCSG